MNTPSVLVSVVDDDESVRESLPDLIQVFGFSSQTFASAQDFLESSFVGETRCLILDVAMPDMTGPELHRELLRRGYAIPTIFITANVDAVSLANVPKDATACLTKPFSDQDLHNALRSALDTEQSDK